mmetsp:Transcript_98747/g.226907  ORF Transcript_98747/g.226907 Transcript_98747/m.226907 type:complete len:1082 (+) Transcript_98747:37-3282(+)
MPDPIESVDLLLRDDVVDLVLATHGGSLEDLLECSFVAGNCPDVSQSTSTDGIVETRWPTEDQLLTAASSTAALECLEVGEAAGEMAAKDPAEPEVVISIPTPRQKGGLSVIKEGTTEFENAPTSPPPPPPQEAEPQPEPEGEKAAPISDQSQPPDGPAESMPVQSPPPQNSSADVGQGAKEPLRDASADDAKPVGRRGSVEQRLDERLTSSGGYKRYLVLHFINAAVHCAVVVACWSEIGYGIKVYNWVADLVEDSKADLPLVGEMSQILAGLMVVAVVLLLLLYLLDYFSCPEGEGEGFRNVVGHAMAVIVVGSVAVICLLSLPSIPYLPLLLTMISLWCVTQFLRVWPKRLSVIDYEKEKVNLMIALAVEYDASLFCMANYQINFLAGLVMLVLWGLWIFVLPFDSDAAVPRNAYNLGWSERKGLDIESKWDRFAVEYVLWGSPGIAAVFLLVLGGTAYMQARIHGTEINAESGSSGKYVVTVVDPATAAEQRASLMSQGGIGANRGSVVSQGAARGSVVSRGSRRVSRKSLVEGKIKMGILVKVVEELRTISLVFTAVAMVVWIAATVAGASSNAAAVVKTFCGVFFLLFTISMRQSLRWMVREIDALASQSKLFEQFRAAIVSPWTKATAILMFGPFVPFLLALSWLNQRVRRFRGVPSAKKPRWSGFTIFIEEQLDAVAAWPRTQTLVCAIWVSVGIFVLFIGTGKAANILLAWMREQIKSFSMGLLVAAVFVIGVVMFLIPVIPGPPVYLFGGLVICGHPDNESDAGFIQGTIVTIVVSYVLKNVTFWLQHTMFGVQMSNSLAVRQAVGVNGPTMRAVEKILSAGGLTAGKCAILCGAPDWPVSVLCGILRLNVAQCLLGCTPIITFIVPICLTGSFLLKAGRVKDAGEEDPIWDALSSLCMSLSGIIGVVLTVIFMFRIQETVEEHYEELSKPRLDFLELDWLDFKKAKIDAVMEEHSGWNSLGPAAKNYLLVGSGCHMVATFFFLYMDTYCFGTFELTSDINTFDLMEYMKPCGWIACGVFTFGCLWFFCGFKAKLGAAAKNALARAEQDLAAQEDEWKKARMAEIEAANAS